MSRLWERLWESVPASHRNLASDNGQIDGAIPGSISGLEFDSDACRSVAGKAIIALVRGVFFAIRRKLLDRFFNVGM